jgi:hypothetical protein
MQLVTTRTMNRVFEGIRCLECMDINSHLPLEHPFVMKPVRILTTRNST